MNFRIILIFTLGCLFSCLLIASCEESLSQISVNGREKRDTRRQREDSNESDDKDDDDDTRKEYKRRYTIQKLLKVLKKSLSRRQLKKVVRKLRTLKRSKKRITMSVIRDTIKEVVAKKGKKTDVKVKSTAPKLTKPPPTPKPQPEKKTEKKNPIVPDSQLVSVQKTPKAPQVIVTPKQPEPPKPVITTKTPQIVETPKQPEPPKLVKPVVYHPPVQKIEKAPPKQFITPYIPPPKSEPPVTKVKINQPRHQITTQKKGNLQTIPMLDGGNVPLDTRITPELKLNIHSIPATRRQEALFNRLLVLRQRVNNLKKSRNGNFRKLRERKRISKPEIVAVSLSGPGSSTSVASKPTHAVVSAAASPATDTKPFKLSSPNHNQNKHYLTPDKTKNVLRTQNHETAPTTAKSSNLSSPPRLTKPTSAEKTKDDFKRVRKIIWVIHSLLSRSKGRKYKVSVKAMKLLRKMARKYKNVMLKKKPALKKPHVETKVHYSVATVVHTGPVDQVGTKSLQSNIPLSNTAEMANPHMMENDIIKQKIKKKSNRHRFSPSILENTKDTYISDSPQAKSHSKAIPKSSSIQDTGSTKKSEQTVVEKTESVPVLPIPVTLNLKTKIEIPSELNKDIPKPKDVEISNINKEILKTEKNSDSIKSHSAVSTGVKIHDIEFKQKLESNKEKDSPPNKIESVINDAPDHLHATFLPPAIEDPSLKQTKPDVKIEKISEINNEQNVEESQISQSVPPDNTVNIIKSVQTDIQSTDTTKFSSLPNFEDPTTNDRKVHVTEERHMQLPADKTNPISRTETSTITETSLTPEKPDKTFSVFNVPSKFEAVEQFKKNNFVDANLDQSPYKALPSDNTPVDTSAKPRSDPISKPNITPLFQQETKNTFFKNVDLNKGIVDTTAIESNSVQIVKHNQAKSNTEKTVHVTPPVLDAKSMQNKLEGIAVIIPDDVTVQKPQQYTKVNTNNLNAKTTNIVDIESSFNNKNINKIVKKDEPTLKLPLFTTPLQNKLEGIAVIIPNDITGQKPQDTKVNTDNLNAETTNIVDIESSFNNKNINKIVKKDEPTLKLPPLTLHIPNQPTVPKTQAIRSLSVNRPITAKVQTIDSHTINQPIITKVQSTGLHSVNQPFTARVQPTRSHSVTQQSNVSKQKVNVPRKSIPRFQISRTNVAAHTNRVGNQRATQRNEKPKVDLTRLGRAGLDKAAILKHLLEIKTMREQLVKRMRDQLAATGRVSERRLSDLLPKSIPSFLNTRIPSKPKQSASISQNTLVFGVDKAKPSLSNPQGTTRAHRRKRSLLSAHHIPGSIIPHSKNEIFVDMPLRSLSYDKQKNNRVDLYGGLGSISRTPPHVGHGRNDLINTGSLSMGFVHPNLIQHRGMTKLERFFRKPVNFEPEPQIPNIANVMNQIFAPGPPYQRPQLFAGNSLSASVSNNPHHKPFHLNASVRKSSHAAKNTLSGFPKRRNFVETAPVKLRNSNRHGVRISVNKDASPGSHAHQQHLQRIKNEKTIATTYMDNSLSLGPPKPKRPIYRTVRRIVILPLPTPKPSASTVYGTKQNKDIVHKSSQMHFKESNNLKQRPQAGYLTKAQPETKSFEDTNKIEYKTVTLDSKNDAVRSEYAGNNLSKSPTKIHQNSKIKYPKHQLPQNKLSSVPTQKHQPDRVEQLKSKDMKIKSSPNSTYHKNSGTRDSESRYSGNSLSLSPPRYNHMKDTTPFVNFAFSLNSPASMFMNTAEARTTKVQSRDYSGSISVAPNSIARAKAKNDKAGPGLSATPFVKKSSNAGIVFEEIDPLSLTNFIMAASKDVNNGGSDIRISTAPVKLTDSSIKKGLLLEIPEKNDFIGKKTQKKKKNVVNMQSLKQKKNTSNNESKKDMPHRYISVRPLSDLKMTKDNTNISPPHSRHSPSEHSHRRNPFSFSLSEISPKSHTHSPKTTVPHSVKPTIKPTLVVPMPQQENSKSSAQRTSVRLAQMQQNVLNKKQTGKTSLSKYQIVENSLSKHQSMKDFLTKHTMHQPKDNSRIQYKTLENSFTRPPLKPQMEKKFTKYPSRDYVPQTSSISIPPMQNAKTYTVAKHSFDVRDNSTTKYSTTTHTDHSTIAQLQATTPSSRIMAYKPTTPNWRRRNSHHHTSGKVGHYEKQSTIEIQGSRNANNHNQIPVLPNQIHGSSLSNRKFSPYTIENFNQLPKQTVSHPASRTMSNKMENTINKSKPRDMHISLHNMDNTISHTKQWATKDLSTSKTQNTKDIYHNPNQIMKPTKMHGYAIHMPKSSTAKHTQSITRPPTHSNSQSGHKSTQSLTSYNNQSPYFIIENGGKTERQSRWMTPSPKHSNNQGMIKMNHQEPKSHNMVYSIYNKPNSQIQKTQQQVHSHTTLNNIQQQTKQQEHPIHYSARHNAVNTAYQPTKANANIRYQKHSQSHTSMIIGQQKSQNTQVKSVQKQPFPVVTQRPSTIKYYPQTTLGVTPIPITPQTPATTKVPVFSSGTERYAINSHLLSLLRQLPVGDLPDHKKRRLERILGVKNGQLEDNIPEPTSEVSGLYKANHLEVSP